MTRAAGVAGIGAVVAVVAFGVIGAARLLGSDEPGTSNAAPQATGQFPEGVFRYRLSKQEVLRVIPDIQPRYLADAVGTFTWTLRGGVISLAQTGCACSIPNVVGRYTIDGDRLTVSWPPRAPNGVEFCSGDCVEEVRWTFDGAALHIDPLSTKGYDVAFWGADKPWRQIN